MLTKERLKKLINVVRKRQKNIVLVLEDIHDPHNAGAIFRTAEAFGIQDVYLIFEKQESYNPRKIGKVSSASANKWLNFQKFDSTEKCLNELKKEKYVIMGTVLADDCESIYDQAFTKYDKIALLIGNEHAGLSEKAISMLDKKLIIPMRGMVQSLNVSVTTAIFIYEISRQRLLEGKKFLKDKKEQEALLKVLKI